MSTSATLTGVPEANIELLAGMPGAEIVFSFVDADGAAVDVSAYAFELAAGNPLRTLFTQEAAGTAEGTVTFTLTEANVTALTPGSVMLYQLWAEAGGEPASAWAQGTIQPRRAFADVAEVQRVEVEVVVTAGQPVSATGYLVRGPAGTVSDTDLEAIEDTAASAVATATAAAESVATLSGQVADRPTVETVEDMIDGAEISVAHSANATQTFDVDLYDSLLVTVSAGAAVTVNATNVTTMGALSAKAIKLIGDGTVVLGTGFASAATLTATATQALYGYRRVDTSLVLVNQPVGTVLGVDDGVNSYTATEIADALALKANAADLGTAAAAATGDFATAAQGDKADTAVQPAALASYAPTTVTDGHETRIAALEASPTGTDKWARAFVLADAGKFADPDAMIAWLTAQGFTEGDGTGMTYTRSADPPVAGEQHVQEIYA